MNGFRALSSLWGAKIGTFMSLVCLTAFAILFASAVGLADLTPGAFGVTFGMIAAMTGDFLVTLGRIALQKNRTGTFFNQVRWYADYRRHHQAEVYDLFRSYTWRSMVSHLFRPSTWLPMSPYTAYERHKENLAVQQRIMASGTSVIGEHISP